MKASEIRQSFLDFFKSKGHTLVPSASLVPNNDPTLLFINAGMNQFKDVFLGTGKRDYTRAADTQKCMRVSGKHNDLEDVGKDTYHHTLFEMLGNWSFGDYYKKEAISWAWELLTEVWKLPNDKLYATVFRTDNESFDLWKQTTDIDPSHVLRFDEKDNFWEMGEVGPCGPCSEIHIDLGPDACDKKGVEGHVCGVNGDCARYIELWNLVFVQYNRQENGNLEDLPATHVDTGMGFERIASVLQGKTSNYETDIFAPILDRIGELSGGKTYTGENQIPMRVIADHIRALTFALADGVMPSNEGRGYVMRKILRRAIRYGKFLGFESPFIHKIVDTVVSEMGDFFPELRTRAEMVKGLILSEEESFFKTLYRGLDKLNEVILNAKKSGNKVLSGKDVFYLYDSLGLPLDFTEHTAEDEGLTIDLKRFQELMEEQKEKARAHFKSGAFNFSIIDGKSSPTLYIGDEAAECTAQVELIVSDNTLTETLSAPKEAIIILNQTSFYGEKGGQVGDTGVLIGNNFHFEVSDTRIYKDTYLHYGNLTEGSIQKDDKVTARVDNERKAAIARNHTATHLLHKALRMVVGKHAEQAGSLVSPHSLRFDFTHGKALTHQDIENIEKIVNRIVLKNLPVSIQSMSKDDAVKSGAVAIFEEKYGETVRVVEVEGFSKELCGGTHVNRSGDIGLIKITSESSVSAGTRRLEAITGMNSLSLMQSQFATLKTLSGLLKTDNLTEKTKQILQTLKDKDKDIVALKKEMASSEMDEWIKSAQHFGETKAVIQKSDLDTKTMIATVDEFKSKVTSGVIFLISRQNNKVQLVAGVSRNLTSKIKAGDLARECAKIVGGGGGGRPDLAQAGGKDVSAIPKALALAKTMIQKSLS